jgi:hypothetical protein
MLRVVMPRAPVFLLPYTMFLLLAAVYPNSGVRPSDGTRPFSMRHLVLRLRPKASSYDVDVLVPPGCGLVGRACSKEVRR